MDNWDYEMIKQKRAEFMAWANRVSLQRQAVSTNAPLKRSIRLLVADALIRLGLRIKGTLPTPAAVAGGCGEFVQ